MIPWLPAVARLPEGLAEPSVIAPALAPSLRFCDPVVPEVAASGIFDGAGPVVVLVPVMSSNAMTLFCPVSSLHGTLSLMVMPPLAPSRTDSERLLLVSPELADILATMVRRLRGGSRAIPLVTSYDVHERAWNPPMPLLFQRDIGTEHRAFTPTALRKLLINALAATGMTDTAGEPLVFSPHDFRRIFVTDAIMNGLPPHIAQVICGHKSLDTTMGDKAIYPAETIEAHRAFIARRRATRPSDEYRTPTEEEWDAFLAHFEKRKVSIGTCARAFSSPCVHEHACVRCSLLRPDPAQRARLVDIRDDLIARIAEAQREGWLGEAEGLQVSLTGAEGKLAQLNVKDTRTQQSIHLGMPTFPEIAIRTSTAAPQEP
ncbi:site-specific integrase [Streptomyces sp. Isolate_219]|uniref:site-specific integrase n=1 Tax=Streptomyces sp. Isolate_219 TaxID=2950110 RepID=UPI0021C74FE5|nr:site-specific integrase [Streptomyces sp. Isolate_219]MCR8574173.1 site-specific integrase [Streptomyces sp. Isolate_219]